MTRLTLTCAALLALSPAPAAAQTACNRACLTGFVDTYFKALAANDPAAVPLAPGVKITNNGKAVRLADAFWASADRTIYRWDIVNERLGDTGTEAVVQNADGSKTMYVLRLKVQNGRIAEVEAIKANQGEADRLWGPDGLKEVSPNLRLTIREAEQDSYYGLIAAAEGYWRAFQTNGTPEYHPAPLLPDTIRFENGLQTTGMVRDGAYVSAQEGFDRGRFMSRNIWDRRYPVVDTERGIGAFDRPLRPQGWHEEPERRHEQRSTRGRILRREERPDPGDPRRAVQPARRRTNRMATGVRAWARRQVGLIREALR